MRHTPVLPTLLCLVFAACGTVDRRIDPDDPDPVGGANLRSQDIRTMADQMARDIREYGILSNASRANPVSFYITEMRNDTSDQLDPEMILRKIRTDLFKAMRGDVMILDRSPEALEEMRRERAAKRAGAVSQNPEREAGVAGSDYVLKGVISERRLQSGRLKSVYYVVTFELTDLETGRLVWTDDYETKFESERSVISR